MSLFHFTSNYEEVPACFDGLVSLLGALKCRLKSTESQTLALPVIIFSCRFHFALTAPVQFSV